MKIWCMRIACWVPKATDTRSEYVILTVVPLSQLYERPSMLLHTYIFSVVNSISRCFYLESSVCIRGLPNHSFFMQINFLSSVCFMYTALEVHNLYA